MTELEKELLNIDYSKFKHPRKEHFAGLIIIARSCYQPFVNSINKNVFDSASIISIKKEFKDNVKKQFELFFGENITSNDFDEYFEHLTDIFCARLNNLKK